MVLWLIRRDLTLGFSSKFVTYYTFVNIRIDQAFCSDDPEYCASNRSICEVATSIFYLVMVGSD